MSQYESYYTGGGGGGFVQGGSPFSATGSPGGGGAQRSEASMSLRPITAAQLAKATQTHADAPWLLDGHEMGQVTLVGQVITIQQHTTNDIYTIEDGTGRAEARHWAVSGSASAEPEKLSGIEDGNYVRLSGFVKSFGNKRYVNVSYMRPIEDFNEIYFHILETIATTLTLERGPHYSFNSKAGGGGSSAYQPNSNAMDEKDEYSSLPPLQQQIVRYILSQNARDGVHVAMIARGIGKPDASAEEISAALDRLMDNGTLYNTIDESHFTVSR